MVQVISRAVLVAVTLALAACETASVAPEAAVPVVTEPVYEPEPGLTPRERLLRSLELLEEGDADRARVEVLAYLERVPRSSIGKDLLLQIDTAPEVYYPPSYQEVVLRPGQSLSNVAKNYLGSAYEFYALARYNDIGRPKRVVPGQVVKVPLTPEALEAFDRELGQGEEPDVDGSSAVDVLAGDATVEEELDEADTVDEAGAIDDGIGGIVSDRSPAPPSDVAVEAEAAMPAAEAAVAISDTTPPEPAAPAIDVDALHREAINAYRSQDLDRAIELWDEILEADPGYESARLYRSQAVALKERLKRLQ
jgi:tetratricopeptide (TPR) repeat protein